MKILCFGEPVLRLSPRPPLMLHQADELMMAFVGSEVVVAKSLALQGDDVAMASVLSSNILGDRSIMEMRKFGVDVSRMRRVDARMAGYYIERGGTMRPDRILYDRDGSAMQSALREEFDWDSLLNGVWCFYFSGVVASITPETGRILSGLWRVVLFGLKKGHGKPQRPGGAKGFSAKALAWRRWHPFGRRRLFVPFVNQAHPDLKIRSEVQGKEGPCQRSTSLASPRAS